MNPRTLRLGKIESAVTLHLTLVVLTAAFAPWRWSGQFAAAFLSLGLALYLRRTFSRTEAIFARLSAEMHDLKLRISELGREETGTSGATAANRSLGDVDAFIENHFSRMQDAASKANITQLTAQSGQQAAQLMAESVASIIQDTNAISGKIDERFKKITEVVDVIAQIESKTKVINDIVFQTKLLSFNASVEAARAGEQGKGFAVVAEEIGSLAQMSGIAALDITQMLATSLELTKKIVNETRESMKDLFSEGKDTLAGGAELARHCGEVMQEISNNATDTTLAINALTEERKRGSTEIQALRKALEDIESAFGQRLLESRNGLAAVNTRLSDLEEGIARDSVDLAA